MDNGPIMIVLICITTVIALILQMVTLQMLFEFLNTGFYSYEGYPENKFRLRILLLQRCGHDGVHAC